ncbi:TonB-dependent receptor plug domain-containing protein [Sphingopyxis macrogoltabida]|nr:TonB-dependent receptor [Sphingopyxis macrogoltabida]ALJ14547.1 hypothetical protein LH19_16875 [Sphingopyxis macrogoltabida]
MRLHHVSFTLGVLLAAPAMAFPAAAQDMASEGRTAYTPEYFARVQPTTAFDMLAILPGFRLVEGNTDVRGYSGAAGNILIDGQRPAGKAETLEDMLKRIPAARVARIELVRAGTPGIDMQGFALLANVVLRSDSRLAGRIEAENALFRHGYSAPRGSVQVDLDRGGHVLNLFGAVYRTIDDEHGFGTRDRFAADGTPLRLADYAQPEGETVVETSAGYRTPLFGGTLRLNGLFKDVRMFADIGYDIRFPEPETITGSERNHTRTWEAGLRYERTLGAADDIELVANHRAERETGIDREIAGASNDLSDERATSSESILRAAWRHHRGALALEVGGEGAINILDSRNLLFEDDVAVPLPNAQVRVEEHRGEFFANSSWTLGPRLTAEAGIRYEISRLTQKGDSDLAKSLAFVKPRARLNWSPGPHDEIRLLVEREVGQLDFDDFVGAASLNAGTISAGNRDLEPETLWRAEAAYEHRFGAGSIVLTARREWISDLVDQLPIFADGAIYDGVGNIGSARRDELEASLKLPLDAAGLKGVLVTADATARRSRATDPSTGERRRISKDVPIEAKISLTHDLPAWHLRWGGSFVVAEEERSFKIEEIETERLGGRLDLFVEYKPDARWTIRLFGRNLTDSAAVRTRDIYTGIRGDSAFRYREVRTLRSGRYAGINIQRSFGG